MSNSQRNVSSPETGRPSVQIGSFNRHAAPIPPPAPDGTGPVTVTAPYRDPNAVLAQRIATNASDRPAGGSGDAGGGGRLCQAPGCDVFLPWDNFHFCSAACRDGKPVPATRHCVCGRGLNRKQLAICSPPCAARLLALSDAAALIRPARSGACGFCGKALTPRQKFACGRAHAARLNGPAGARAALVVMSRNKRRRTTKPPELCVRPGCGQPVPFRGRKYCGTGCKLRAWATSRGEPDPGPVMAQSRLVAELVHG